MVTPLCRCRYCGQESPLPLLFTLATQRVVNCIIANPWCSIDDIELGVYGCTTSSNVVTNRLCQIRQGLKRTKWRLRTRQHPKYHHRRQYIIVELPQPSRTVANVDAQSPHSLP